MRTIAKPFLSVAAGLLFLLLGPTLLLDLWLLIPGSRDNVQGLLARAAGGPVSFSGLHGVPLIGITATDVRIARRNPAGSSLPAGLEGTVSSVTIRPSITGLLHGNLTLSTVILDHPVAGMRLGESQPASLHSPAVTSPTASVPGSMASPSSVVPPAVAASGSRGESGKADIATPPPLLSTTIRVIIRHGELHLAGPSSIPLLDLTDVNAHGSLREGAEGSFSAARIAVAGLPACTGLKADLRTSRDGISLVGMTGSLAGGILTGKADALPFSSASPWRISLNLKEADLGGLLPGGAGSSSAKGKVSGSLSLEGYPGEGNSIHGGGELSCREAVIEPVDFLRKIGRILSVDELQLLQLSEGKCLFRVVEGKVVIDELFLKSQNLCLAAKGPVGSTGELDLDSRILLNESLASRLRGLLGRNMTPAPEPGFSQIAFHVSGPAANPRTDLLERLTGIRIGGDLGGLGNLLQGLGLFGRPAQSAPPAVPPQPAALPQPPAPSVPGSRP